MCGLVTRHTWLLSYLLAQGSGRHHGLIQQKEEGRHGQDEGELGHQST